MRVKKILINFLGINLTTGDVSEFSLEGFKGVTDNQEQQRKSISNTFVDILKRKERR